MTDSVISRVPLGDLGARASQLAARLERKEYRPETVLKMDGGSWPGDWEGRTMLAVASLAESTGKTPAYLDEIEKTVKAALNERGYLGKILPDGEADEQQLSGHSWLMRGFLACARYHGEETCDAALGIFRGLFLPVKETYSEYPIRPEERVYAGGASGEVAGKVGRWHISTDTGCAYIPLDGLTDLYEFLFHSSGAEEGDLVSLRDMIDTLVAGYARMPFREICVQTHATLTAARGILRMYRVTGEEKYLARAREVFDLYTRYGMTANYANQNWFGRPEWTEPCAIIDSFMLASGLFAATGEDSYIRYAQRIYYNGMGFGQRENGGFGCDSCTGAKDVPDSQFIGVKIPEAYWCCTMRGGEGLRAVCDGAFLWQDGTVILPYFVGGRFSVLDGDDCIELEETTEYPYAGRVSLTFQSLPEDGVRVCAYLPKGARAVIVSGTPFRREGNWLLFDVEPTPCGRPRTVRISFSVPVTLEKPEGEDNRSDMAAVFFGNLMLSADTNGETVTLSESALASAEIGRGTVKAGDLTLHPLYDAYEAGHSPRQVLFPVAD